MNDGFTDKEKKEKLKEIEQYCKKLRERAKKYGVDLSSILIEKKL